LRVSPRNAITVSSSWRTIGGRRPTTQPTPTPKPGPTCAVVRQRGALRPAGLRVSIREQGVKGRSTRMSSTATSTPVVEEGQPTGHLGSKAVFNESLEGT
jgi:hypothetical protein